MDNKYNTIELITERLILKKGTIEDFLKVYEYDFTYLRGVNGIFEYKKNNPETIKKWFPNNNIDEYYKEASEKDHMFDWIIYLKDTLEPIGNLVYDRENEHLDNSLEISYNIHPKFWGNGYIGEALTVTMNHIFNKLNYDYIICGYASENAKSKRISEKLGFDYYSERKEHYDNFNIDVIEIETIIDKEKFNSLYIGKKY
jgi:ribosomal-protein-alanine N-acetyltransferase